MKKGVKIAIIIGIIIIFIVIIAIVTSYLIIKSNEQKEKLLNEIGEIEKTINAEDLTIEKIEEKTNKIVTEGSYAKVETAIKKYISELYNEIYNIKEILEDEKMGNILEINNIKNNQPDFIQTKEYINTTKQKIEESKNKIIEYTKEEKINSYIKEQNVSSSFEEIYKSLVASNVEKLNNQKSELEEVVNTIIETLKKEEDVINFLVENKGKWKIQGEQIIFDKEEQAKTYTELINKILK